MLTIFRQVLVVMSQHHEVHLLPWAPEVFSRVRRGASFRWPQAEDTSGEVARKNLWRRVP